MSPTASRKSKQGPDAGVPVHHKAPTERGPVADVPAGRRQAGRDRSVAVRRRRSQSGRAGWIISVLVAAAVGVAGFLAGGFEYRASVELVVTDAAVPAAVLRALRRDLLDHAWKTLRTSTCPWRVDLDEDARVLSVALTSPDRAQARASISLLATTFVDHIRGLVDRARAQPGPDELVLAEFRRRLGDELLVLTGDVRRIESTLPREDCEAVEAEVGSRLATGRAAYARDRKRVREAEAELAAIVAAPLPDRAAVDPETRARANRADVEVQQDLKALRVQLAEICHQLLRVRESASPALDDLRASTAELEALCSGPGGRSAGVELRLAAERIGQSAADYSLVLAEFSQAWMGEFDRLRTRPDDPRRAEAVDVQAALDDAASGFIFQSSGPLTAIREQVRAASTAPGPAAKHHEFASSLVRAFHGFQSAHHRFEFAAADVKPSNNFRLDAALKSARGLRYRSRRRLAQIGERLSRQATTDLRADRDRRRAALKDEIGGLRRALDASVEGLLATQERADEHARVLQNFLQARTVAGLYEERIKNIAGELRQIETRLNDLAAKRMDVINPDHLQIAPYRVDRWPANLPTRLLQGAVVGVGVLILLVGLRMWVSPKVAWP